MTGRRDEKAGQIKVWRSLLSAEVGLADQGFFKRGLSSGGLIQMVDETLPWLAIQLVRISTERSVHESAAQRNGDCMSAVLRTELVQYALHASFDSVFRHKEFVRNTSITKALRNEA